MLLYYLLFLNLITFLAFGLDKWRARRGTRRTPERTLLVLTWLGGVFGAWFGSSLFRHKTRKSSFRNWMILVSLLNLAWLLLYLHWR